MVCCALALLGATGLVTAAGLVRRSLLLVGLGVALATWLILRADLTSRSLLELRELPEHLLVVGGGFIGCEFAQMFARFGARVTVVQRANRLIPLEEPEVSAAVAEGFATDRILGCHIAGPDAGNLVHEAAVAMAVGASYGDIGAAIHAHPTMAEAVNAAAGGVHRPSA